MGRPKLDLACSVCKRGPDQVRILSNRYCVDCMSDYNREQRQKRIAANSPNTVERMIMDPTEEYIFTDSHWEEYEPAVHGPKLNVKHLDFDEAV